MKSLHIRLASLLAAGILLVTPSAAYALGTHIIIMYTPFRAVFIDFLGQQSIFV